MSRYIDADKLKAHYAWWGREDEEKKLFDSVVDVQPTADVVEVKHGNWTNRKDAHICSCCNEILYIETHDDDWGSQGVYEYCPYCGAKMDGKDGDEK